jgi:negative regulator of sigma E activity
MRHWARRVAHTPTLHAMTAVVAVVIATLFTLQPSVSQSEPADRRPPTFCRKSQDGNGVVVVCSMPKLSEGVQTDPVTFEQQQKRLRDELERRAEEARRRWHGEPNR